MYRESRSWLGVVFVRVCDSESTTFR